MGRRAVKKVENEVFLRSQGGLTLREKSSEKNHVKPTSNIKSVLKVQHLQRLAEWASKEVCIPSLGAFFGDRLSVVQEMLGVQSDASLYACERCKSILEPGINCRVRIESNKTLSRQNKPGDPCKNYVVYTCNFCSHKNLKMGTPKGHMKAICSSNYEPNNEQKSGGAIHMETSVSSKSFLKTNKLAVPSPTSGGESLSAEDFTGRETREGEKCEGVLVEWRKRGETTIKDVDERSQSTVSTGGKKRRKSWTCLKEIAEGNTYRKSSISDFKVPFLL